MEFASIEELEGALARATYLPDRGLATALYLALSLEKPVLLEGGVPPPLPRVQLHQAPVRGLVQGVEGDEPMRHLDRGLDAMVVELVDEERLEGADRHPAEALAFSGQPLGEGGLL